MILKIVIAVLLLDGIMACLLWLMLADEIEALDGVMAQAERRRDRALEDWFRAQDLS